MARQSSEEINAERREKYATDPAYRERMKQKARERHAAKRQELNEARRRRYAEDPHFRRRCLDRGKAVPPHIKAASDRKTRYGTDGDRLLQEQRGMCAVCEQRLVKLPRRERHLDHDHVTGRVRGWLCGNCNRGIGKFRDNPALLRAAADYLEKSK